MKKIWSSLLILAGVSFIMIALNNLVKQKEGTNQALVEAEQMILEQADEKNDVEKFVPVRDEVVGVLHIPKINAKLPIIEGTEEEMLAKGVGHYESTAFPGEDEQILLSGHRDSAFRNFGELEKGDRFIIEMPYGSFEYEMKEAEIVDANDTSVIGPRGEEILTLSTCYPFNFIGSAPDRYIIYAAPINE